MMEQKSFLLTVFDRLASKQANYRGNIILLATVIYYGTATLVYRKKQSYLEMAKAVERPKAVRAVGRANGKNCLAIIVPCHRVVGSDGKLTGYGGGLWRSPFVRNFIKVPCDHTQQDGVCFKSKCIDINSIPGLWFF